MSRLSLPKITAISIGLSLLAVTAGPALAQKPANPAVTPLIRKQRIETKVENKIENIEDRINTVRERIASKAAELRLKLQTFRDKKKAEIAERINTALNRINQNQTEQMRKHLKTMSLILNKLEARVRSGAPDIKDTATASAAIVSARTAIASASAAVEQQALKDYTIQVTSESKIATDAKTQRDRLHTDLQATRKMVQNTKQAVANAIRLAKSGFIKEGTASGKQ